MVLDQNIPFYQEKSCTIILDVQLCLQAERFYLIAIKPLFVSVIIDNNIDEYSSVGTIYYQFHKGLHPLDVPLVIKIQDYRE